MVDIAIVHATKPIENLTNLPNLTVSFSATPNAVVATTMHTQVFCGDVTNLLKKMSADMQADLKSTLAELNAELVAVGLNKDKIALLEVRVGACFMLIVHVVCVFSCRMC